MSLSLVLVAACSDSVTDSEPTTPTTSACSSPAPTAPGGSAKVVAVNGTGDRNVGLPADVTLPAIVHAAHLGAGNFFVSGVDSRGKETQVLAAAARPYDGTFAVGFVDDCANPTVALHIQTRGRWHLDITAAANAHRYAAGVGGRGDSVFIYTGHATHARISYAGVARFILTTYTNAGPKVLTNRKGPIDAVLPLPPAPMFVAIVAHGAWKFEPS